MLTQLTLLLHSRLDGQDLIDRLPQIGSHGNPPCSPDRVVVRARTTRSMWCGSLGSWLVSFMFLFNAIVLRHISGMTTPSHFAPSHDNPVAPVKKGQ